MVPTMIPLSVGTLILISHRTVIEVIILGLAGEGSLCHVAQKEKCRYKLKGCSMSHLQNVVRISDRYERPLCLSTSTTLEASGRMTASMLPRDVILVEVRAQ